MDLKNGHWMRVDEIAVQSDVQRQEWLLADTVGFAVVETPAGSHRTDSAHHRHLRREG